MIPSGLFSQLALLLIAGGIIVTYISPTFDTIAMAQEQIAEYQSERNKVQDVNATLESRIQTINSIFPEQEDRLLTYMPDTVDRIVVMRDLETMAKNSGVLLERIEDRGAFDSPQRRSSRSVESSSGPYAYNFNVTMRGSYQQTKQFFEQLENNHYPLQVESVDMRTEEGGFILATININTFSVKPSGSTAETVFDEVNVTYD